MLGAGLQFNRSRNGEDRFYSAARARRSRNQSQVQDHLRRAQSDVTVRHSHKLPVESKNRAVVDEQQPRKEKAEVVGELTEGVTTTLVQQQQPSQPSLCNLERLLESTTTRGWRTCDVEFQPYFVLGDLWESFKEWSAYGVGVPLILNESDCVIQYYVPYLSGIQLYGDSSKSLLKSRHVGEDSDVDSFRDSCSDGSSDCEHDRGCLNYSREQHTFNHRPADSSLRMDQLSLRNQQMSSQEGFSSDESEPGTSQACLLFEYLERDQPYGREPLADKISQLAQRFPDLKTLRSCDIQPSSWISVACYPIYRIPMGPTLKDLDACFLTFHSLHTPVTGYQSMPSPMLTYPSEIDGVPKISLPVFGLAHYKFKPSLWIPNGGDARPLLNSLLQVAENFLNLLQVNHPDFLFFRRG